MFTIKKNNLLLSGFIIITIILFSNNLLFSKSSFSGQRLQKACYEYVQNLLGENAEIIISSDIHEQNFEESGVTARCSGRAESFRGNCYIIIEFLHDNKLLTHIQVPLKVKIYQEVAVASHTIIRGNLLTPEDIIIEKKDITHFSKNEIINSEELIGKRLKRNIAKDAVIERSLIEDELLVHRGDKVSLVVQFGSVRVRTAGEALQDAAIGKKIRIKREGSQTILQGKVDNDGSVIISNE
jgi:flagella basal body P-ring formation protein FlgA